MPYITVEENVDIDDILSDCSPRELVEAAKWLVENASDDVKDALVEAMKAALAKFDPEGIPVPYLMSGGTDNKALSDLGIIGYGFSPVKLPPDLDFFALFHGVDERVPIDGLKFGVKVLNEFLQNS